jgi:hypothetical protein
MFSKARKKNGFRMMKISIREDWVKRVNNRMSRQWLIVRGNQIPELHFLLVIARMGGVADANMPVDMGRKGHLDPEGIVVMRKKARKAIKAMAAGRVVVTKRALG